jgi:hypothetical protein
MKVGYAWSNITPHPGITLSGFAARRNRPSNAVDDPLFVRALALEDGERLALILAFDLLALGSEMDVLLHAALDMHIGKRLPRESRIFCATHTHSAPATITLLGCGVPEAWYWRKVVAAAVDAAENALARLRPATFRAATVPVKNGNYNRRRLLADGRVVMAQEPEAPVRKSGPDWERVLLLRFDDEEGNGIAGIASWAAHPATVCTRAISADFPGEICQGLMQKTNFPFMFLQGACANLNPPSPATGRAEMLRNSAAILVQLEKVKWPARGQSAMSGPIRQPLTLKYTPRLKPAELEKMRKGLTTIAISGVGPEPEMKFMGNILNVPAGQPLERETAKYFAGVLCQWCAKTLEHARAKEEPVCELNVAALGLGKVVLAFVAAEVFVETALAVQAAFPKKIVNVVGYASPLVGYLPTDEALKDGGYEADFAYRFYNHPAPFARGSEKALVALLTKTIRAL